MISLLAKLLCNVACFLYPAYASYKALSFRPQYSPAATMQIERWLMYWAVVGSWTAVEATAGWMFTWFPFYSVWKALFFLYLSLPQSEGSSWIYQNTLAPFFYNHERDIDAFLASLRSSAATALAGGLGWLWNQVREQLSAFIPPSEAYADPNRVAQNGPPPPTMNDPASGTVRQVYSFFSYYAAQYVPSLPPVHANARYVPVALTALQAAATSATARPAQASAMTGTVPPRSTSYQHLANGDRPRRTSNITAQDLRADAYGDPDEYARNPIAMPMPIPTPQSYPSDPNLRSRAHQFATQPEGQRSASSSVSTSPLGGYSVLGLSSARGPRYPGARPDLEHPRSASTPTGRPISQRGSEESIQSSQSGRGAWNGEMSYETIRREDVPEQSDQAPPVPARPRPEERRRSSWFGGWGAGAESEKPKGQ